MKKLILLYLVLSSFIGLAQETKSQLTTRFDVIRNETAQAGNTKARIANAYQELSDGTIGVFPVAATGTNTYTGSLVGIDAYSNRIIFTTFQNNNTGASTINYNSIGAANIQKDVSGTWTALDADDIVAGKLYRLYHDGTRFQIDLGGSGGSGGDPVYTGNSPSTRTVEGISSGTDLSVYTHGELLENIYAPYVYPTWNSFSISGQSTTVEVGTTLSGSKTFTWSLNANSGVVSTIDLYNVSTSATLLAGTPNDGSQAQTITTVQLNSSGSTQSWRGVANNSSPSGTVNSSNFTVTSWFYRFYGPTSTAPTNSATVRALPSSAFVTGAGSFTLATGSTEINFVVCLPPGRTITSVIDASSLNADITSSYVLQSSINVTDAGGTARAYVVYKMTNAVPYGASHDHIISYN